MNDEEGRESMMSMILFVFITVFIASIQIAIPYLMKRTVVFGVTIPEQNLQDENIKNYKKQYAMFVAFISFLFIGAYIYWCLSANRLEEELALIGAFMEFLLILVSLAWYFYYHSKAKYLKKINRWGEDLKQVKVTDLSVRNEDEMLPWMLYILPILITISLGIYTVMNYEILPDQIPTHWGANGQPDAFTNKTPFTAISMSLLLFVMQLMFLGIHLGTKKSGIKLSATSLQASRNRQLSLRKYSSWFTFFTIVGVTMLFTYLQLTTIHPTISSDITKMIIPAGFLILIFIGTILLAIKVGRADKIESAMTELAIMEMDEDQYWKGGLIYFNKNDPSIFVEKRFGIGWTLNFANPIGYCIVFLPLIVILVLTFI